jgi:hypothetical protein
MTEETLSEKIEECDEDTIEEYELTKKESKFLYVEDVKDFIKKLKERFPDNIHIEFSGREINNVILDLAGKELI